MNGHDHFIIASRHQLAEEKLLMSSRTERQRILEALEQPPLLRVSSYK